MIEDSEMRKLEILIEESAIDDKDGTFLILLKSAYLMGYDEGYDVAVRRSKGFDL